MVSRLSRLSASNSPLPTIASHPATVALYFWVLRPLELRALAREMELEAARGRADHLLQIDPLTGVANRRTFFEHFEREWDRTSRYATPLTCIMMDLDLFRNDLRTTD
jgi:predicted signal transduction protein with EAL and GGDEF domain